MSDPVPLSPAAYERLRAEHEDLTTRGRIDIARKIQAARELGDLKENGDYHAAKEEQGKMEGRVAHLASILDNYVIVEAEGGDVIAHGSVVTIMYEGDDDTETYLIGSIEERHEEHGVISPSSPLGKVLVGASKGETVSFASPGGGELKVTIVEVEI